MPAIPSHDTATVDQPWDGPAAEAALSNDAGEATYRRMYAWVDGDGDPDTKSAYRFPHHEVTDGTPGAANLAGVRNGLSRLPQATTVPENEKGGVEAHLRNHMPEEDAAAYDAAKRQSSDAAAVFMGGEWRAASPRQPARPRADDGAPRRRSFALEVRAEGEEGSDSREVSGRAVTYTERNSYWEVFVPGAFAQSLADKSDRKPLVMGYGHTDPIGKWTEFAETRDGLDVRGRISDTTLGRDALTLIRDGALTGLSIGFYPLREQFAEPGEEVTFDTEDFGEVSYRFDDPTFYVTEADVVETSIVMAPADDEARLNARRRALRSLPEPDAPEGEILAAIRALIEEGAADDDLDRLDREAIVMRLAGGLRTAGNRGSVAIPAGFDDFRGVVLTQPPVVGGGWTWSGTSTGSTAEPAERSALTDLLDGAIELMGGEGEEPTTADTLEALAEAAGIEPDEVADILDGTASPSRDDLVAFADALGLDADDLIAAAESDGLEFNGEDDDAEIEAALTEAARLRESVAALSEKIRPTD